MGNEIIVRDKNLGPMITIAFAGGFKVGQLVLVHQSGGIDLSETGKYGFAGMKRVAHDCTRHEHWVSRVLGWCDIQKCPMIATRVTNNPNHCEWPYGSDSLEALDIEDWVNVSQYKPGDYIRFVWDGGVHYPKGTILESRIEIAHIEPGDWYVSFPVPDGNWRFKRVVNEREFVHGQQLESGKQVALPAGR